MLFWILGKSKFDNNFHSKPIQQSASKKKKILKTKFYIYRIILWFIIMASYEAVGNIYNDEDKK